MRIAPTHEHGARRELCGPRPALTRSRLGDDDAIARSSRDEVELRVPVDTEGEQITGVDADRVCTERNGSFELVYVMGLDEGVELELMGCLHQSRGLLVVEVSQEQQDCVRSASFQLGQLVRLAKKAFRQERHRRRGACRAQVVDRACETLVDEHRDGRGAGALEVGG
jgi:hypothetical protein